jgi:hypothetical protein
MATYGKYIDYSAESAYRSTSSHSRPHSSANMTTTITATPRPGFAGPMLSQFTPPAGCMNTYALSTLLDPTYFYTYRTSLVSFTTTVASTALVTSSNSSSGYSSYYTYTYLFAAPYRGQCNLSGTKNTCLPSGTTGVFSPAFSCPRGFSPAMTISPGPGPAGYVYITSSTTLSPGNTLLAS